MPNLLLTNAHLILDGEIRAGSIRVRGGQISAVQPGPVAAVDSLDELVLDCGGELIVGPGLVDIHVHGGGGKSFFTRQPAAIRAYAQWAPRNGVTSFLVSTAGRNADATVAMLGALRPAIGTSAGGGAEALGFHLEGPFLNPLRHGAFSPKQLLEPSVETFARFQEAANDKVRQMTLAPELPGALEVVRAVVESGAVAAMGHTDATHAEALAGFEAGVAHVTHVFNAIRPVHQREGGAAIAALLEARVTCEVICDGAHVSPEMVRLAYRMLGRERMVVITDNMNLAGTTATASTFGGGEVAVSGAVAARPDGTIVGSIATMDQHFRNVSEWLGLDWPAAFALCSTNPAHVAGVGQRKGRLAPGYDADIVAFDAAGNVRLTICRGEVLFDALEEMRR